MTIYARTARSVQVTCKDDSCDNLSVYCPTVTNQTYHELPKVGRISPSRMATTCAFNLHGNGMQSAFSSNH